MDISSVKKTSGLVEPFSLEKLKRSIERTGISSERSRGIAEEVHRHLRSGHPTHEIFNSTFHLLRHQSPKAAAHYALKRSIFELGPEGHHFESYVARYFQAIGYKTQTCVIVQGRFVRHEIDVVGEKDGKKIFVECKFHNHLAVKNDIKIALYVKARWDDIKEGPEGKNLQAFYLVTNTSFTSDAITYSKGTGLQLLGINAPETDSFLDHLSSMSLYPITSLRQLPQKLAKKLLERKVLLVRDLLSHSDELYKLGLGPDEIELIMDEVHTLLGNHL